LKLVNECLSLCVRYDMSVLLIFLIHFALYYILLKIFPKLL
jgi:hypothetical protein